MSANLVTQRLAELEAVIERGWGSFIGVGRALMEIRDSRLYRETYATFDDYCRERWFISRIQGHREIAAVQVVDDLLPIGNVPRHESVARELIPLSTDGRIEAARRIDTERRAGALLLELKAEGEYGSGRNDRPNSVLGLPPIMTTHRWQDMARVLKAAGEYGPGVKCDTVSHLPDRQATHRWQDMARVPS